MALEAIKDHARSNANATVAASADSLTSKLNSYAFQSSQDYANSFNTAILDHQNRINNELFGSWLNTTAVTLNNTLVEFYGEVESILNTTFGGTIIYGPINTFLYCILGSKINNLEQGLTWVSQHAQITLPTLPPDVLLLSNSSMDEIAQPVAAAAVGSGGSNSGDQGIVGSLIEHYESALTFERNFYAILLGVWLGFALVGLCVLLWHSGGRDRYVAWRGAPEIGAGGRSATPGLKWLPWKSEQHPIYDQHLEKPPIPRIIEPDGQNAHSFFDYNQNDANGGQSTARPSVPRKGTFGSTIPSLAAPGQAFLRLTRWGSTDDVHLPNAKSNLVNGSSEKYTGEPSRRDIDEKDAGRDDEAGSDAPQFWVNKWYRAVGGAKAIFPSRGQRHGAAMARGFNHDDGDEMRGKEGRMSISSGGSEPRGHDITENHQGDGNGWTMVDPRNMGRALDGLEGVGDDSGRYPTINSRSLTATSSSQVLPHHEQDASGSYEYLARPTLPKLPSDNMRNESYPRRMSRAPTLGEGYPVGPFNPFDMAPAVPRKDKHDSVDYLEDDADHHDDEYARRYEQHRLFDQRDVTRDRDRDSHSPYDDDFQEYSYAYDDAEDSDYQGHPEQSRYTQPHREDLVSPVSSTLSYLHNEAHVESVNKVPTGTAALASILEGMKEKRAQAGGKNPFGTPFDSGRGGRI